MIAIVPGYISRSVAGSYDNEGIAIFCMLLTYYMWIKSVKTGSLFWSTLCALAYFYMVRCSLINTHCGSNWCHPHVGQLVGRLRVPDQPHSDTRSCPHVDRPVLT